MACSIGIKLSEDQCAFRANARPNDVRIEPKPTGISDQWLLADIGCSCAYDVNSPGIHAEAQASL